MKNSADIIGIIKERFEGKEIWCCEKGCVSGLRINIGIKSVSLCHEASIGKKPDEIIRLCDNHDFNPFRFYEGILGILDNMQNEEYLCRSCPMCKKRCFISNRLSM